MSDQETPRIRRPVDVRIEPELVVEAMDAYTEFHKFGDEVNRDRQDYTTARFRAALTMHEKAVAIMHKVFEAAEADQKLGDVLSNIFGKPTKELKEIAKIELPDPEDERDGIWLSRESMKALAALPAGTKLYVYADSPATLPAFGEAS